MKTIIFLLLSVISYKLSAQADTLHLVFTSYYTATSEKMLLPRPRIEFTEDGKMFNSLQIEKDTATQSCLCNNQTVYVRFGYNPAKDTSKTFIVNLDTIRVDFKKKFIKENWQLVSGNVYTKTFKYIPATAVAYDGSLKKITKPFRFPYSVIEDDDPEGKFYYKKLCSKILLNLKK